MMAVVVSLTGSRNPLGGGPLALPQLVVLITLSWEGWSLAGILDCIMEKEN